MATKKLEPQKTSYSPNSRPVWCGEWTKAERKLLERLPADERREALVKAASKKPPVKASKPAAKPEPKAKPVKKSKTAVKAVKPKPSVKTIDQLVASEQPQLFPES